ncbi:energy transducer TonB [Alteromonas pelagimontana]|uniref:Energy transducer TonB n=1 Tax=Alteromonas pelagimontana TaxID=1858656 RepID=A0A6M4MA86_9ALTE|nr:energy transducer TonB [Alteromonas pelagimontana]QJR80111.1 energy transducer TonB [Alteromonas pelagimontana]
MRKYIFGLILVLGVGCSSSPKQMTLASQPADISLDELEQYWEMKYESFSFDSSAEYKNRPKGYVKIRYLIDSTGNVFEPKVVESEPSGVWDDQGMEAIKELKYLPSKDNPTKIPVYVTTEFQFKEVLEQR